MVVDNGAGTLMQTGGTLELGTGARVSAGTVQINGGVLVADGPAAEITASLVYTSSAPEHLMKAFWQRGELADRR